jgi:hypothetical protein
MHLRLLRLELREDTSQTEGVFAELLAHQAVAGSASSFDRVSTSAKPSMSSFVSG